MSHNTYKLGKSPRDNNVLWTDTDYPSGWSYKIKKTPYSNGDDMEADGWLKVVSRTDNGIGEKDKLVFSVTENTSRYNRTGYIHITAGRMNCVIKVEQSTSNIMKLDIDPGSEILFPCGLIKPIDPIPVEIE